MKLNEILKNIEVVKITGPENAEIEKLCLDSRDVLPNSLFFAVSGTKVDGHNFIESALEKGAIAIVSEKLPENLREGITYVEVKNTSDVVGLVARNFFGNDFSKIRVVGVTGTNGKTTIATMLYQLFTTLGHKSGLLSTVENIIGKEIIPATHTTGDAIQIQENISKMIEAGCEYCFMEASSHAIDQRRICGIDFAGGIFTNLTQDHLDYHTDMETYARVKKSFFDILTKNSFAVYNSDDARGEFMVGDTSAQKVSYGENAKDFKFEIKNSSAEGLELQIGETRFTSPLVGKFNAYNIAAIFATVMNLGIPKDEVIEEIAKLHGARGRMEKITGKDGVVGLVDYAHTPDALQNALETINGFKTARVITVFGAGGDRDKTKRPLMGEIVTRLSDLVIVTSDNPRSERPEDIIADILTGISDKTKVETIVDRKEAIKRAVEIAQPGDAILVAGKGHEDYQDIAGVKSHFDDREILIELLK